jgi:ABC-type multidrug transport system ATPase subunit
MPGTSDPDLAIDIRDVTVGYQPGVPVLNAFSAQITGRGVVAVRGHNGAGKSTLVEVCSGYLRPWRGAVRIRGLAAHSPAARRRRRVCRTEPALYPNMTARDHLVFASRCLGVPPEPSLARAEHYGLAPWLEHDAKSLSAGNRRKLWLIMCTSGSFDVVLLDEPFNGLDTQGAERLGAEIREWSTTGAVVLNSHTLPPGIEIHQVLVLGKTADD